jgi:hypothetical protein
MHVACPLAIAGAMVGVSILGVDDAIAGAAADDWEAGRETRTAPASEELPACASAGRVHAIARAATIPTITSFREPALPESAEDETIVGILVDEDGAPLADFPVQCTNRAGNDRTMCRTSSDGEFRFTICTDTNYIVRADDAHGLHAVRPLARAIVRRPFRRVRLVARKEDRAFCWISGRVVETQGSLIDGATVVVKCAGGGSFRTKSANGGRFWVDGMQTGEYALAVTHPSYRDGSLPAFRLEHPLHVGDVELLP